MPERPNLSRCICHHISRCRETLLIATALVRSRYSLLSEPENGGQYSHVAARASLGRIWWCGGPGFSSKNSRALILGNRRPIIQETHSPPLWWRLSNDI